MKLVTACHIAHACGLTTTAEAYMNIDIHAISVFTYDKLAEELHELATEYYQVGDKPIAEYFKEIGEEFQDD